ncbi:MFS transporter (plasmid) [Mycolicibacterium arabiense]|uniref:Putative proline/betaine transporter n=1 Tax=Mycolicibacterium arabiense TaxID=1286181 RepID=A0A7I7RS49_9MYCO|nr:MFS transporter [Mycolicibacterium arabiense]MCV7372023.1 MFS transporter [Mycolicibacterium arabiense]BBY46655.1 MFS transporter [Mycolicibacterium arabiense]
MTDTTPGPLVSETFVDQKSIRKSVVAGSVGVFVHWFDWAIYAYLASTLSIVFFPDQDGTAGLLAVFGVFAISFGARPIGALLFGALGDRIGRKKTLTYVILAMAASTMLLGLLPSYASIGIWAPILLLVARIIQGLAAGGEFGSAAAFLAEYSPTKRRGFGVSFLEVGSLLGFLGASLAVLVLNTLLMADDVNSWGWRIPFLLATPLGLIGFYIRNKIEDTPEFRELTELDAVPHSPIRESFTRGWRQMLQTSGIEIMMNVTFYIVLVYLLTYQEIELGISTSDAALFSTAASIAALITVPLFGALSDRVGRRLPLIVASVLLIVFSYPLFLVMHSGTSWAGLVSTVGLGLILAVILGVHAVTVAELFPTRTRQTSLSIVYAVTAAIFPGTVPYVLTWLIAHTGNQMMPAFYLILVGLLGLGTMLTVKETRGIDLLRDDVALAQKSRVTTVSPTASV